MPVRRTLVECVVLSLNDARVLYPCCRGCFSRTDVEHQDRTRCRCSRCGYSCLRDQVDYRYRLSMRVARDGCIFGVTVFGTCVNPFFGIHASGLQRLVGNLDEASTRYTLLVKAVKDCFIGRHFIFGIKVTETDSRPWLGGPVAGGSSSKEAVHFIATQMILPKATALGGCTVVSYYQVLLQRAAQCDPSETSRPPAATLLLVPRRFPASSFNNGSLSASGLLSPSPQSSQHQDYTPPWRQSLGLVTSSAEQEEDCGSQHSGDDCRQTGSHKTPRHAQRGCLENHEVTEERAPSPLLPLECSTSSSPSLAKYPCSSTETAVGNQTPPGHNSSMAKWFSPRQLTRTFSSSSLAWDDLPFSESLTEFLCENDKYFDTVGETEPHLNVQNQKETTRSNRETSSRDENVALKSTSACQSNAQITDGRPQTLLDVTNTPAFDRVYKNPVACADESRARNIYSHERDQEEENASSLCFENEEEEQLKGDTYNCSADLFSSSLIINMSANKLDTHAETVGTTAGACPPLSKRHPRGEKDTRSTTDKQKLKRKNRGCVIPTSTQHLDFIPHSQSTPIVKVTGSPASSYRTVTLAEFTSQPDGQDSGVLNGNNNRVCAKQLSECGGESKEENLVSSKTSNRYSPILTPIRRFWKPDRHGNRLLSQQHPRVQRGGLNRESALRINHRRDSNDRDVTVCDYADDEVIVPPTPAAETQPSVKLRRRRRLTANGGGDSGCSWEGKQGDGVDCKRTLLGQTLTSPQRGLAQTVNCSGEAFDGSLDGSHCNRLDDENEACDWSRDLFSDSI